MSVDALIIGAQSVLHLSFLPHHEVEKKIHSQETKVHVISVKDL